MNLHLSNRFFYLLAAIVFLFALSFVVGFLFIVAKIVLALAVLTFVVDIFLLYHKKIAIEATRKVPPVLSLGDENTVSIHLRSRAQRRLHLELIDELPFQLQSRDFNIELTLVPDEQRTLTYPIRPTSRGEYQFGNLHLYLTTVIGLAQRGITIAAAQDFPVFPSIIQMKKFELLAISKLSIFDGIKRQRRIGHSYEFEQIKTYVRGDDYRSINWKATGRRAELMVNQYEDERSQQIYCIIDKSRTMKMPFYGLSLMDYAINTSLVLTNIALRKYDRAGLITFSDRLGSAIKADRKANQLNLILNALYNEKERNLEANFELLFQATRNLINGRSLILLYTNFESMYALERVLPLLRKINMQHLLVVIFFKNTEIEAYAANSPADTEQVYQQAIAQKFLLEKQQMVQKLRQYGIQTVLTAPEDLNINTINKYLELKARGLI